MRIELKALLSQTWTFRHFATRLHYTWTSSDDVTLTPSDLRWKLLRRHLRNRYPMAVRLNIAWLTHGDISLLSVCSTCKNLSFTYDIIKSIPIYVDIYVASHVRTRFQEITKYLYMSWVGWDNICIRNLRYPQGMFIICYGQWPFRAILPHDAELIFVYFLTQGLNSRVPRNWMQFYITVDGNRHFFLTSR